MTLLSGSINANSYHPNLIPKTTNNPKTLTNEPKKTLINMSNIVLPCVHCGESKDFEVWIEPEYNDGADEPHTGGNYLINVEYAMCKNCGEVL